MSTIKVRINTQYYENYNFYDGGEPHWKAKGGYSFILRVDSDLFLYDEDVCVDAIRQMLKEYNTDLELFEYRSHELIFHDEVELNKDRFEVLFNKMAQNKYSLTENK